MNRAIATPYISATRRMPNIQILHLDSNSFGSLWLDREAGLIQTIVPADCGALARFGSFDAYRFSDFELLFVESGHDENGRRQVIRRSWTNIESFLNRRKIFWDARITVIMWSIARNLLLFVFIVLQLARSLAVVFPDCSRQTLISLQYVYARQKDENITDQKQCETKALLTSNLWRLAWCSTPVLVLANRERLPIEHHWVDQIILRQLLNAHHCGCSLRGENSSIHDSLSWWFHSLNSQ